MSTRRLCGWRYPDKMGLLVPDAFPAYSRSHKVMDTIFIVIVARLERQARLRLLLHGWKAALREQRLVKHIRDDALAGLQHAAEKVWQNGADEVTEEDVRRMKRKLLSFEPRDYFEEKDDIHYVMGHFFEEDVVKEIVKEWADSTAYLSSLEDEER